MNLQKIPTCKLVEELKTREGVCAQTINPHEDQQIQINGPAIVLIVID